MYDALNTRIRETSISQGLEKSPFRIVEEPLVTSKPVYPEVEKDLGHRAGSGRGSRIGPHHSAGYVR